jgi:acetyltransferase
MLVTLADGTRVVLRPIAPSDKASLQTGLGLLSRETVRRRFLAMKPSFSSGELRYLTEVDGRDHLALVAAPAEAPGALVAVARCVRDPDAPDTAELAVVVADPLQRRGLGTALVSTLAAAAREVGIVRFEATMLADNDAAWALVRALPGRVERDEISAGRRELLVALT